MRSHNYILFFVFLIIILGIFFAKNILAQTMDISSLESIVDFQESYRMEKPTYQRLDKFEMLGVFYWTDEYVTPSGETGYIIYAESKVGDLTYVKAINYGVEYERSFDWTVIKDESVQNTATSTL